MTTTNTITWNELKDEVGQWSIANFGEQPSWMPLMGAGEEVGELAAVILQGGSPDFIDKAEARDAIGDAAIFLMDYCSKESIHLHERQEAVLNTKTHVPQHAMRPNFIMLTQSIGQCMHLHLKREQGIREGTQNNIKHQIEASVYSTLVCLLWLAAVWDWSLTGIVEETWAKVRQRNWKKDAESGAE